MYQHSPKRLPLLDSLPRYLGYLLCLHDLCHCMEAPGYSRIINNLARTSIVVPLTMPLAFIILLFNLKFLLQTTTTTAIAPSPKTLNITTIATNAQKESVIECWELIAPFVASAAAGISGAIFAQLGETGATSYGLIPAEFDGGLHNAPVVQWVSPYLHQPHHPSVPFSVHGNGFG